MSSFDFLSLFSVVAMPRDTGCPGPLLHHLIHHLCMAYSHLERMMNLTPAHIRNHYFSREDMSHLRVPRSDPINNQVLGDYIFDMSEPPRWETLSLPSPTNSPSLPPSPSPPPPQCAATEFFDYHDDLPSFGPPGHSPHRMTRIPMTNLTSPNLLAIFYQPSPSPSPLQRRTNPRQSIAALFVKNLADIVIPHQIPSSAMELRLLPLHHLYLLVLGHFPMINYFAPTKKIRRNVRAGKRWLSSYVVPKMIAKPGGTYFAIHLRRLHPPIHPILYLKNHPWKIVMRSGNLALRDARADLV